MRLSWTVFQFGCPQRDQQGGIQGLMFVSHGESNWPVSASRGRRHVGPNKRRLPAEALLNSIATPREPPTPPFGILRIHFNPSPKCRDFLNSIDRTLGKGYVEIGPGPFQRFFGAPREDSVAAVTFGPH